MDLQGPKDFGTGRLERYPEVVAEWLGINKLILHLSQQKDSVKAQNTL